MPTLQNSDHFISIAALPILPLNAFLPTAFAALHEKKIGGLLAKIGDQPTYYFTGKYCAAATAVLASRVGWEYVAAFTLRDLIIDRETRELKNSTEAIKSVIAVAPGSVSENVDRKPLIERGYTVYKIVDQIGSPIGWFLNHEGLMGTVRTDPPYFRCEEGHLNDSWDSGYCFKCPRKITGVG